MAMAMVVNTNRPDLHGAASSAGRWLPLILPEARDTAGLVEALVRQRYSEHRTSTHWRGPTNRLPSVTPHNSAEQFPKRDLSKVADAVTVEDSLTNDPPVHVGECHRRYSHRTRAALHGPTLFDALLVASPPDSIQGSIRSSRLPI